MKTLQITQLKNLQQNDLFRFKGKNVVYEITKKDDYKFTYQQLNSFVNFIVFNYENKSQNLVEIVHFSD
jgi:hypothetical protein